MKTNDIQHGGDHYKKQVIQPWDYIAANNLGYFEGNVVKYVSRWKDKGGVEDLRKARHYIDKLIELNISSIEPHGY
jgi:exo-beta-1,3-glucanase (GH17 family)